MKRWVLKTYNNSTLFLAKKKRKILTFKFVLKTTLPQQSQHANHFYPDFTFHSFISPASFFSAVLTNLKLHTSKIRMPRNVLLSVCAHSTCLSALWGVRIGVTVNCFSPRDKQLHLGVDVQQHGGYHWQNVGVQFTWEWSLCIGEDICKNLGLCDGICKTLTCKTNKYRHKSVKRGERVVN